MRELEPLITDIVVDVINKLPASGPVDIVKHFSVPITIRVICEQLGVDQYNADKLSRWSQAVTAQIGRMQDREKMRENAKEICDLQHFLIAHIKDRQAMQIEPLRRAAVGNPQQRTKLGLD